MRGDRADLKRALVRRLHERLPPAWEQVELICRLDGHEGQASLLAELRGPQQQSIPLPAGVGPLLLRLYRAEARWAGPGGRLHWRLRRPAGTEDWSRASLLSVRSLQPAAAPSPLPVRLDEPRSGAGPDPEAVAARLEDFDRDLEPLEDAELDPPFIDPRALATAPIDAASTEPASAAVASEPPAAQDPPAAATSRHIRLERPAPGSERLLSLACRALWAAEGERLLDQLCAHLALAPEGASGRLRLDWIDVQRRLAGGRELVCVPDLQRDPRVDLTPDASLCLAVIAAQRAFAEAQGLSRQDPARYDDWVWLQPGAEAAPEQELRRSRQGPWLVCQPGHRGAAGADWPRLRVWELQQRHPAWMAALGLPPGSVVAVVADQLQLREAPPVTAAEPPVLPVPAWLARRPAGERLSPALLQRQARRQLGELTAATLASWLHDLQQAGWLEPAPGGQWRRGGGAPVGAPATVTADALERILRAGRDPAG